MNSFSEQDIHSTLDYYPSIFHYPKLALMLKTGYLLINFKDKQQSTPNHMKVNYGPYIGLGMHGRATSVLILAIRGQNRLANARLCLPQPSSSPHPLRHA
ncbi:MAG: hypothetical protein GY782_00525 [Gammaproteobacteria bacterium]|nr:hypothetical protein [Gammaproteobacteria bacterium]